MDQRASRRRVPLRVVTAFEWTHDHRVGEIGLGKSYRDVMLDHARRFLAEAVEVAERAADGLAVEQQLIVGLPIPVFTAESTRAQLVVIGDRGLGGVTGMMLGSVAIALAGHAESPVVVVRGDDEDPDPSAPVVVGVDGSPVSEPAMAFAYEAAAARGVPLVAVHTWPALLVDPLAARVLDFDAIEADERRPSSWPGGPRSIPTCGCSAWSCATVRRTRSSSSRAVRSSSSSVRGDVVGSPGCCSGRSATRCCTARTARSRSSAPTPCAWADACSGPAAPGCHQASGRQRHGWR